MKKSVLATLMLLAALTGKVQSEANAPLVIARQGNFSVGGKTIQRQGTYDNSKFVGWATQVETGQSARVDHAFVDYQVPVNANKYPLVFVHGYGGSGVCWEMTPDLSDQQQDVPAINALAGATKEDMPFREFGNSLPAQAFHGEAYRNDIISNDTVYNFPQTNVITFAPGSHSNWHRHGGMDILVTGGVGIYQEKGKPAQVIRKGDVLHIPAGTRHWHGAAPGNWFQQIVVYDSHWRPQGSYRDGDNTVSDSYYNNLSIVEFPHQNSRTDISTFLPGDSLMQLPTFTGLVRLSSVLGKDNASGAPAIANVVFEPGVYNAWHKHPGGQIFIVTDGVCYHQVKGKKVEVLHPGDVGKCPPGETHWHGAAPGSRMAHLAIGTNPGSPKVQWFKPISKKQYDKIQEKQ